MNGRIHQHFSDTRLVRGSGIQRLRICPPNVGDAGSASSLGRELPCCEAAELLATATQVRALACAPRGEATIGGEKSIHHNRRKPAGSKGTQSSQT